MNNVKRALSFLLSLMLVLGANAVGNMSVLADTSEENEYEVIGDGIVRNVSESRYEISNYEGLKKFALIVNGINGEGRVPDAYAVLTEDIVCKNDSSDAGYSANWTPIGLHYDYRFLGIFDGQGHVITGLTTPSNYSDFSGLFGYVGAEGIIRNVGIAGGKITGKYSVGGVTGRNYGTVSSCYYSGEVSGESNVGGVVGNNHGTVVNCYNTGKVSCNKQAGGVVGFNDSGTVANCYSTGSVTSAVYPGGVVGYNTSSSTVKNCYYDRTLVLITEASESNNWNAVGNSVNDTVIGLTTAQMTGADALSASNMFFEFEEGATNPWLVKTNHCKNDFYPHLTGFNLDENGAQIPSQKISAEKWPSKTNTGTGGHQYGVNGDGRFTCTVCGYAPDDLISDTELTDIKEAAKQELVDYKNPDDYRPNQQAALADAIAAGKNAIDNAAVTNGVETALANAKAEIDKIKTDAQLSAEELDAAKTAAKQELDEYKNPDDYRAEQQTELQNAISDGKDAIDNAADTDGVASALADAKAEIDKIKTDAQLTAEELAANKEAYNRYKEQKLGEIDAMAQEGDSQQCSDIISGAKMHVAMLYYNENISLDENKSVIDAVVSTLIDSLEAHRKVYHVVFVDENGTTVDEVPYTIDTVSIEAPEVPVKEGYDGAWEEYKLTSEDIIVKPVYTPANICKLDGEYHGDTFFGKLITFFHNLIWTAFSFIGLDLFVSVKIG